MRLSAVICMMSGFNMQISFLTPRYVLPIFVALYFRRFEKNNISIVLSVSRVYDISIVMFPGCFRYYHYHFYGIILLFTYTTTCCMMRKYKTMRKASFLLQFTPLTEWIKKQSCQLLSLYADLVTTHDVVDVGKKSLGYPTTTVCNTIVMIVSRLG